MSITLYSILCLLHLLNTRNFLYHGRISKDEALELMVDYVGVDLETSMREMEKTIGARARFEFLKKRYIHMSCLEQRRLEVMRRRWGNIKRML